MRLCSEIGLETQAFDIREPNYMYIDDIVKTKYIGNRINRSFFIHFIQVHIVEVFKWNF